MVQTAGLRGGDASARMEVSRLQDERTRVEALRSMNVLFTPAEARFDRITRIAQRLFRVPISLVALVEEEFQWFKSVQGLNVCETSRAVSFCTFAIQERNGLVVEDAKKDPRFSSNPLVTDAPHIRFYAGRPLRGPDGHVVGTLCIIDQQPRQFGKDDAVMLRDLAMMVEDELYVSALSHVQQALCDELGQAERRAMLDPLMGIWNRGGIEKVLRGELEDADCAHSPVSIALIDVDHFKKINDTYGHDIGDTALRETAARMRFSLRPYDAIGRFGGEEFMVVLRNTPLKAAERVMERLRTDIEAHPMPQADGTIPITVSAGVSCMLPGASNRMEDLVRRADQALYQAKQSGRNQTCIAVA